MSFCSNSRYSLEDEDCLTAPKDKKQKLEAFLLPETKQEKPNPKKVLVQLSIERMLFEKRLITDKSLCVYVHSKEDLKHIADQQGLRFLDLKKLQGYVVKSSSPKKKIWRQFPPSKEETEYLKNITPNQEEWKKGRELQDGCSTLDLYVGKGFHTVQEKYQLDQGLVAPREREEDECFALSRGHFHEDENRNIAMAAIKADSVTCPAIWIHQSHFRIHCSPDGVVYYNKNKNIVFNPHFEKDHHIALIEIKQTVTNPHALNEKELNVILDKLVKEHAIPKEKIVFPPNWIPAKYVLQQQMQMDTARTQEEKGMAQVSHSMFSSSCRFDHLNMPTYHPKTGRFLINRYFSSRLYYNAEFCQEIRRRQELYYQHILRQIEPRKEDFEWTEEDDKKYVFKFIPEFYIEFWLKPALDSQGNPRIVKDEKGTVLPCMKRKKDGTPFELIGTVEVDEVVNWQSPPQYLTLNQFAKLKSCSFNVSF